MFINNVNSVFTKTETDIFSGKSLQNSVESSTIVEYRPVSAGTDDLLEFFIAPGPDYIDTSLIQLQLKVRIVDDKGVAVKNAMNTAKTAKEGVWVCPVNNFADSLFSNIAVYLNHKIISTPSNCYMYRGYIEKLCNYGREAKTTHLEASMYIEDEFGKFDDFDNKGSLKRLERMHEGCLEMISYLHTDLSSLDKLLLNNVSLRFKLYRNRPSFSLMTHAAPTSEYKIEILDAVLLVRKVKLSPAVAMAHEIVLKRDNARYCIERVEIKTFTLPAATNSKTLENIFMGQLPKRVLMFQVVEDAMFNLRKNPNSFGNHNLTYVKLSGDSHPNLKAIKTRYDREEYMEAYTNFNAALNLHFQDTGINIDPYKYKTNACIYAFDLTPDGAASQSHLSIPKSGTLRLELNYKEALEKGLIIILYAEYENYINIDAAREIFTDYAC